MKMWNVSVPNNIYTLRMNNDELQSTKKEFEQAAHKLLKEGNHSHVVYGVVWPHKDMYWFDLTIFDNDDEFYKKTDLAYSEGPEVRVLAVHKL